MSREITIYSCVIAGLLLAFIPRYTFAEDVLTWDECIREAAKNHPDLIAAMEEVKQSEANKTITASTLFPQINSGLTAQTARSASDHTAAKTGDAYNYGLSGSQLIFDGNKTINNVRAAAEDVTASNENFQYTSAAVRFSLRSAFINLLTAQENITITQQIYRIRRDNFELITLRYQSGLEHKGALMQAQADLADAKYRINLAKRDVVIAQRQMIRELGRNEFVPLAVKGSFQVRDTVAVKPDFAPIIQKHPSLLLIAAQKNAAEFNVRSTYGNFAPELTAQAGANKNGAKWSPKGDQWNLGLSLSMPIFEGGLRFAQVAQAKAQLGQLRENERSIRDGLAVALEETWAALQDMLEKVGVQKLSLAAAQERSKIAQVQYSIGLMSFDNWTIIEDNLVQAKSVYLAAQSDALLAEAAWVRAKGETLEYEN